MTKQAHDGALRNNDSHGARRGTDVGAPQYGGSRAPEEGRWPKPPHPDNGTRRQHSVRAHHKAPSSCANSFKVPRRSGSSMWRRLSGWPASGLRIRERDFARTASSSPSVNNVPMRRPSRPSRAISTASSDQRFHDRRIEVRSLGTKCFRTSVHTPHQKLSRARNRRRLVSNPMQSRVPSHPRSTSPNPRQVPRSA